MQSKKIDLSKLHLCRYCMTMQPFECFNVNRATGKPINVCKSCNRERVRQWRAANREFQSHNKSGRKRNRTPTGVPEEVLLDPEDRAWLSQFSCWVTTEGYCRRKVERSDGRFVFRHVARDILGLEDGDGLVADHINGNPLDNRRCNLRAVERHTNQQNRKLQRNNRSGYNGVSWSRQAMKWHATARHNGKLKHLGYFHDVHDAGRAAVKFRNEHYKGYVRRGIKTDKYLLDGAMRLADELAKNQRNHSRNRHGGRRDSGIRQHNGSVGCRRNHNPATDATDHSA